MQNNEHVVYADKNANIVIQSLDSYEVLKSFKGDKKKISCLVISNDKKWVAFGGFDKKLKIYDLEKYELIFESQEFKH